MEVNGCFEMIPIPKSIGHLDDGLDLGINPLTDSIGYSMPKVRKHILKVTMERSSCLDDGLQSRMGCPEVPPLEMSRSPSFPGIVPEVPETLFNRPRPSGFQVAGLQFLKMFPVLLRKVLLTVKPKILRLGQWLVSPLPPAHSPSSRQCKGPKYPWPRPQSLAVAPPKALDNSHPDSLADDHRQDTPPSPYPGHKPT